VSAAAQRVVRGFWKAMASNDFHAASLHLTEDFRLQWPQSDEMVEGRDNFAALNAAYPATGRWTVGLRRSVGDGAPIATEVGVRVGPAPERVGRGFWKGMARDDFPAAARNFPEDFRVQGPQSDEMVEGRGDFAALYAAYPATGLWTFDLRRIVGDGDQIVTEVGVSDGTARATALTLHTVRGDLIALQREFGPDPFEAPQWRAEWVRLPGR